MISHTTTEEIEIKQNLFLTAREGGKIVCRREGHNIWLRTGSEWVARLLALASIDPDVPEDNSRIKYMGVGVGGNRQFGQAVLAQAPYTAYVGTNDQTDQNPLVTSLERPVRVSGGATTYPGTSGDVWIAAVQAPAEYPQPGMLRLRRVFTQLEVSYDPFLSLPLSEIALYNSSADPSFHQNVALAYDTFDPISKTRRVALEVVWELQL